MRAARDVKNARAAAGRRRQNWYTAMLNRMFLARMTRWASPAGRSRRSASARRSRPGTALIHVGERCSMVTPAAVRAMAGTRVTAVAPLPTTSTRRPVQSRSSGQNCGCTTRPPKSSRPGSAASWPRS